MGKHRFLADEHIRSGDDFERVYNRRSAASDHRLLVFVAPNELSYSRLGLSVSKKVGNAVVRNRWKRLLRESFRLTKNRLQTGLDLVIIPRAGATPDLAGLMESLPRLTKRAARKLARNK